MPFAILPNTLLDYAQRATQQFVSPLGYCLKDESSSFQTPKVIANIANNLLNGAISCLIYLTPLLSPCLI